MIMRIHVFTLFSAVRPNMDNPFFPSEALDRSTARPVRSSRGPVVTLAAAVPVAVVGAEVPGVIELPEDGGARRKPPRGAVERST